MPGNFQLTLQLFLQLTVILAACRLVGLLLRRLGQPQVVGEMVAGVLLGPSFFGLLAPQAQQALFPTTLPVAGAAGVGHPSMNILSALAQVGLVLYMFIVGLDLDRGLFSRNSRAAAAISVSGVVVPAVMGGLLGLGLSDRAELFGPRIVPWQAALFVASAMSITAFPMLARIIHEKGITRTRIGTLSLGAAALDDAAAWCLLACVVATSQGSVGVAALAIGGGLAYALVMFFLGRPAFRWFERATRADDGLRPETAAVLMLVLMLCAWVTDFVGIHAVFGAFVAGAVMPRGRFAAAARRALETVTVSLLLPVFFVFSGLNTRVGMLIDPALFAVAAATMAVAFACKWGGCMLACRLAGSTWRESASVGVLMNARGMMELILVNIALERGLITHGLFTILVLMAIATTLAAAPLFQLLYRPEPDSVAAAPAPE